MHADTTIDNQEENNLKMTAIVLSVSDAELKGDFFIFFWSQLHVGMLTQKYHKYAWLQGFASTKALHFFSPNTASV